MQPIPSSELITADVDSADVCTDHAAAGDPEALERLKDLELQVEELGQVADRTFMLCVVTPDATVTWLPPDSDAVRAFMDSWRADLTDEQRARHQAANTRGGAVLVTMLKSDYELLRARNRNT
jgi:hypothetical protein